MTAAADLRKAAAAARNFAPAWLRDGSRAIADAIDAQLLRDTGGDRRFSGARRLGTATVEARGSSREAHVTAGGSETLWRWLEDGTRAHTSRGKRRPLRTPRGPRWAVEVRGTRAKRTWEKGNGRGVLAAEAAAIDLWEAPPR